MDVALDAKIEHFARLTVAGILARLREGEIVDGWPDGDVKDEFNRCERPVRASETLEIPACLDAITAEDVVRAMERISDRAAA